VDNFIIDALVTVTRPGGKTTFPPAKIRVHVHGLVTDVWLAPRLLSIREGADGQSFSVLASFDDGTVGDLTTQPGIIWTGGNAAVSVDRTTGRLLVNIPLDRRVVEVPEKPFDIHDKPLRVERVPLMMRP
jgi:hypothetical protein